MHRPTLFHIVLCCWLVAFARPALAYDVAIYAADLPEYYGDAETKLIATGLFDSITVQSTQSFTPTLADLQQYDAVILWSDYSFSDAYTFGDNLADYMDGGGGVVIAVFAFNSSPGLGISGRIQSDGYLPFTLGGNTSGTTLTLVEDLAGHALLDGVTSFNGGTSSYHHSGISTAAGATQVAHWDNGVALVSYSEPTAGICVGLNFFPGSSDSLSGGWDASTDGDLLLANALLFAAGGADTDGDGWSEGDGDCDDDNPNAYPGAPEICDDGIDQNCDGVMNETVDNDGDGFSQCDGDCNDTNLTVCPGCPELCDELDNDCDPLTDETDDADNDGFSECDGDCDDAQPYALPGGNEVCDGIDNDCNGLVDDGWDYDHDGYSSCDGIDCDDNNSNVNPGAVEIPYNGIDEDCDGSDLDDMDGDGYAGGEYGEDCDDTNVGVNPGATEICDDGLDGDCDGLMDDYDTDCAGDDDDSADGYDPAWGTCGGCDAAQHGRGRSLMLVLLGLLVGRRALRGRI